MKRFTLIDREYHPQNTGFAVHDHVTETDVDIPLCDFEWQYQPVVDLLNELWELAQMQTIEAGG